MTMNPSGTRVSGVRYSLQESNTTDLPSNAGATTYNRGMQVASGALDEIIIKITTVNATGAIVADFGNVIQSLRLILNGTTITDFRSGYASAANNAPSQFGYFLNSLGSGRMVEVPSDLTKEVFFRIPVGRNIPALSRLEYTLGYAATAAAVTSGTFQVWFRFNDRMTTTTTVAASTSFNHSISEEQVIVRLPQGVPGTVAGVFIQNDSAADQMDGLRILSQSDFSMPVSMIQAFNGDMYNGVVYADDGVSTTQQTYAIQVAGGLFVPLFGLSLDGGDIRFQVNSTAVTTRTYTPVIVAPVNGAGELIGRQTQPVVTNTNQAVLAATTETV